MKREFEFTNGQKLEVGTFFCIGQNYAKHAREMGGDVSKDPVVFFKPPAAYIADGETIRTPEFSELVHHEVELVVVIGKDCADVEEANAAEYIAGFAVGIDVTARDVQKKCKDGGKPWATAKGFRTSAPVSKVLPFEVFKDKYADAELKLEIGGKVRQLSSTKYMERSVEQLISYLSKVFTLQAGDAIFTGTPEGVGEIKSGDAITAYLGDAVSLTVLAE